MDVITGILKEAYDLFGRMAPFLLFGYFFAGILNVFIKAETISAHLGGNSFKSVLKAALFGVPLPLCSCAVIPAALSLRKEGASRGAVLSFLISTPTTGVDAIFATYSLLGAFFTVYRVLASLVMGILSGALANVCLKDDGADRKSMEEKCNKCVSEPEDQEENVACRIRRVFKYAYVDLLRDTGPALLFGILLGGAISFLMPKDLVEAHLGYGVVPMVIMLLAGLPMYVCATASIPIAASLMIKGLAPGAAFVFLVAGPATNIVTMSVVVKSLGKRALAIYLISISVCSIAMGGALNFFWQHYSFQGEIFHSHSAGAFSQWVTVSSSTVLFALIMRDLFLRFFQLIRAETRP